MVAECTGRAATAQVQVLALRLGAAPSQQQVIGEYYHAYFLFTGPCLSPLLDGKVPKNKHFPMRLQGQHTICGVGSLWW